MSSSLGPVYNTLFINMSHDNSSFENSVLSRSVDDTRLSYSEDEAALSCAEDWIEPDDVVQVTSTLKIPNTFLGDPEKVNLALKVPEKSEKNAVDSCITKKESSKTKHSTFFSLKINESKLIDEAMEHLAGMLRLEGLTYSPHNQLRALAELARLLENEGTKSLLNKALLGEYKDLIKIAGPKPKIDSECEPGINYKNWVCVKAILDLNACEPSEQPEQPKPVSGTVNHNGHINNRNNTNCVIEEKNIPVQSSDSLYPFYPKDDSGIPLEEEFLKAIKNEGKNTKINKKRIRELVQAYPLFTDEVGIIKCLSSFDVKNKEYVLRFFKELSRNSLPGQLLKSAKTELQVLHGKFKETEKILKAVEKEQADASKKIQKNNNKVQTNNNCNLLFTDWRECDAGQFSRALALRDCGLVQKINLSEVINWFYGQCEQPQSVIDLEKTYEATVQWIAYQIVSELDEKKRLEIIQKFFKIGCTLNSTYKNFHSASQIARAFKQPSVFKLLPREFISHLDSIDLMSLASDDCVNSMEIGTSFFPINQAFWDWWQCEYKSLFSFNSLENITKYLLKLKNFYTFDTSPLNNDKNDIHFFLANLKTVPYQTIDELYNLFYKMEGDLNHTDVKLADWNSADLAFFILKNDEGKILSDNPIRLSLLNSLYSQGIYNGKQFIAAFSKNKDLIETKGWGTGKQFSMWNHYLMHLSS